MSGQFIVIEGPNGVGKTTIARQQVDQLTLSRPTPTHLTAEPSDTPWGRLLRSGEARLIGRALALAIAADRYAHLEREIIPHLDAGHHVVSDRYVQSSLVLQRIDGLTLREVWRYNAFVPPPAFSFYLEDAPAVLADRLGGRGKLSRLERSGSPEEELRLYRVAFDFLDRRGWRQCLVDCHDRRPAAIVASIFDILPS
jgi:dTMP kinase